MHCLTWWGCPTLCGQQATASLYFKKDVMGHKVWKVLSEPAMVVFNTVILCNFALFMIHAMGHVSFPWDYVGKQLFPQNTEASMRAFLQVLGGTSIISMTDPPKTFYIIRLKLTCCCITHCLCYCQSVWPCHLLWTASPFVSAMSSLPTIIWSFFQE